MRQSFKLFLPVILVLFSMNLWGQQSPQEILTAEFISSQSAAMAGETLDVALIVDIQHPWHVYAPMGNDEFTIPVSPSISADGKPFKVGKWIYPEPEMISVAGVEEPAGVYGGRITIRTTLELAQDITDPLQIEGEVYYQACDDAQCLIPATINFSYTLPVVDDTGQRMATHSEHFQKMVPQAAMESMSETASEEDEISGLVDNYGIFLTYFIIFFGGLALNLTPCVYPLIPITISFFGGQETSKGRTFWMALAYVLGIAVTYSILGVVAALGGGLFGALLTNPFVLIGIAAILVGLSLSMFGVYEFRLPTGLMTAASQSKAGIFGSFFMGLTLGIVAAPCVGPFVIGLLTYVAAAQSVVLGFTMFFTLAMGLGLPYLFLAMYSSKLSSLPRSGTWMIGVRVIFGLVLIAMAIYFLMPLLGEYANLVMSIFLIGSGVYLIMFDNSAEGNLAFNRIKQAIAIILIVIGTWMGIPEPELSGEGIVWEHPTNQVELEALLTSDAPIMIDVYADWCIPCKEMDKFTFPDREVVNLSKKFTAIKIDMTRDTGEFEKYFLKEYSIKGVPSYIFLKNGVEHTSLRSTGYENADDFLKRMKKAL
ncbi:MAG: thioredoxin fold domain-containing protein [Candidatus Marinimicrobia bacterium]|jgi:thiol:disulfide interchange protein DsbD|nr:thioredoxin fold domain-containing protein [Candidatus Neomarinimicrobiota bacterium]MBT3632250.1 thioredoxin fold domain-containing protein [Candidatus Neomarinimicrobiota bacterium]MBT3825942.1 thioredoxin fold domain-containing protein [Candidatus Neomarinimicrobiota bacterium]MBT4129652.1 thioredoxin fold domain-containing protein [Candidatus Neomarinimicrobiota bacterium]MBT4294453.1 thioredoxin fold domain-containing protein [Candidatus Neomarinimicrobiota bacterium]